MKTIDNNPQYAETLAKYLSGEMNENELRDFENEIAVSEENKTSIEKMKKQWSAMKGYKEQKSPDTRDAWNKLHSRLDEEKLIPNQLPESNRRIIPVFLKAAAVIIILLGVGAVIYLQVIQKPSSELVRVNTGNEAYTLVKTLNDGSVIYIAQNSLFSFPEKFENKSRNVELKGEAFFDIASNPEKPFIIETDEAFIEVLGTAFNVKTKNGKGFELIVDRGKVKVTLKKDPSHSELVVAGEKINEVKNSLVKSKHVASQENTWYKQRMHFKDESLQNVISVLNRNFNTTFAVAEEETGTRKFSIMLTNQTADTMTALICAALNLKSQDKNGAVVFSENNENAGKN